MSAIVMAGNPVASPKCGQKGRISDDGMAGVFQIICRYSEGARSLSSDQLPSRRDTADTLQVAEVTQRASGQRQCQFLFCPYPIAHRLVAALALLPHAFEHRVTSIDVVVDQHFRLAGVFAMQAASILLQGALPRNRHGQHQRIERWVIETFADQPTGSKQYAWGIPRQGFKRRQ